LREDPKPTGDVADRGTMTENHPAVRAPRAQASATTVGKDEVEGRSDAALEERLAALVGQPVGTRAVSTAPDAVNLPMIRHWAAAFEDWNPVYTDPAEASRSRFGGIVAPPLMLQTWIMATPMITGIADRGGSPVEAEGTAPLAVLDEAGYRGTLATNSEFEIVRYLRLGEVITADSIFESISEEKQTRLGPGRFVTWTTQYRDAAGEVVGRQRFRILKFRPPPTS
jgi:uncharacterized protein